MINIQTLSFTGGRFTLNYGKRGLDFYAKTRSSHGTGTATKSERLQKSNLRFMS